MSRFLQFVALLFSGLAWAGAHTAWPDDASFVEPSFVSGDGVERVNHPDPANLLSPAVTPDKLQASGAMTSPVPALDSCLIVHYPYRPSRFDPSYVDYLLSYFQDVNLLSGLSEGGAGFSAGNWTLFVRAAAGEKLTEGMTYSVTGSSDGPFLGLYLDQGPYIEDAPNRNQFVLKQWTVDSEGHVTGARILFQQVTEKNGLAGKFSVVVSPSGSFTLNLLITGVPVVFHGRIQNGYWEKSYTAANGKYVDIALYEHEEESTMTGYFAFGSTTLGLNGRQTTGPFLAVTKENSPFAGAYTWATMVSGQPSFFTGYGCGALHVSPSGNLRWIGSFSDGARVSSGGPMSLTASFPIFIYHRHSLAYGGSLYFVPKPQPGAPDIQGSLVWQEDHRHGEGFGASLALTGCRYTPPQRGYNLFDPSTATEALALGIWTSDGISMAIDFALDATEVGAFSNKSVRLTGHPGSGLFSGSWRDNDGNSHTLHGAILQSFKRGYGYFSDKSGTGSLKITEQ